MQDPVINELNVWTMQQVPGKRRRATMAHRSTDQQTCQQTHVGPCWEG
jgi:hypothetical protein